MKKPQSRKKATNLLLNQAEGFYSLEQKRRNLIRYAQATNRNYVPSWHHRLIAEKLEAVYRGEIKRLIITVPPRHGKTELTSKAFPSWCFGRNPNLKMVLASYSADLASSINKSIQRFIESNEYQEIFPNTRLTGPYAPPTNGVKYKKTSKGFQVVGHTGEFLSAGVGGALTGFGGDILMVDDPIKNIAEAMSPTYRQRVWDWYTTTFETRLLTNGAIIIIQTRWHSDDLVGRILEQAKETGEKWDVLNLPAILEDERQRSPGDKRKIGEALWPEKYDRKYLAIRKQSMGTKFYAALYDGEPKPNEGSIIKESWFKFYKVRPDRLGRTVISCDLTFGASSDSDYCVFAVYTRIGGQVYLLERVREKMKYPDQLRMIKVMHRKYPSAKIIIEKKANGQAVIDSLSSEIPGVLGYNPTASKEVRLDSVSHFYEAGNILYPDHSIAPWIISHMDEIRDFPNVRFDDAVDAESQALHVLLKQVSGSWSDKMTESNATGLGQMKQW